MFRAFSDPIRLRILNLLQAGELCVCDLVDVLRLPQPTISRHLSYLRRASLVTARRERSWNYYALAQARPRSTASCWTASRAASRTCRRWPVIRSVRDGTRSVEAVARRDLFFRYRYSLKRMEAGMADRMIVKRVGRVLALLLVALTAVTYAADLNKALTETEGRRRAAENGLRDIKKKSARDAEQVRALYTEAASANNAWLETVCQAIQQGAANAPDVATSAQSAADALVAWVNLRNRALSLPVLDDTVATMVKRTVVQNLTDIAAESWKKDRRNDERKRTAAVARLKERLQWKAWDAVQ